MTDAELEAIEKACAEATPGPWTVAHDDRDTDAHVTDGAGTLVEVRKYLPPADPYSDAAFIAGARSWVPALVAEVRRLRVERDGFKADSVRFQEVLQRHGLMHVFKVQL